MYGVGGFPILHACPVPVRAGESGRGMCYGGVLMRACACTGDPPLGGLSPPYGALTVHMHAVCL